MVECRLEILLGTAVDKGRLFLEVSVRKVGVGLLNESTASS